MAGVLHTYIYCMKCPKVAVVLYTYIYCMKYPKVSAVLQTYSIFNLLKKNILHLFILDLYG